MLSGVIHGVALCIHQQESKWTGTMLFTDTDIERRRSRNKFETAL